MNGFRRIFKHIAAIGQGAKLDASIALRGNTIEAVNKPTGKNPSAYHRLSVLFALV